MDTLEVVKTTLSVALFFGAVLAGVYAYRKQRISEAESHRADAQSRRADAEQLAERYTTAAAQMGSERAAIRLAGIYAMARLADSWPDQRQTCIDVLCAYLRMPTIPPETAAPDARAELQVRTTIHRVIASHLWPGPQEISWSDYEFDLAGADLTDVNFDQVLISGLLNLRGAKLAGYAAFGGAVLSGAAWFDGATFDCPANFSDAQFHCDGDFDGVTFAEAALFHGTVFSMPTSFIEAKFSSDVSFAEAKFTNVARFTAVIFEGEVTFMDASFRNPPPTDTWVLHQRPELSSVPLGDWPETLRPLSEAPRHGQAP